MDKDVPYLPSIRNLHSILDGIQRAAVPESFNFDFLRDMGFASSNDRAVIKLLKYLGLLDASNRPQTPYREFMDSTKAKTVLAARVRSAYDDLFTSDKSADSKPAAALKGWFKTKTGVGEAVAEKMATTFRALAQYADFSGSQAGETPKKEVPTTDKGQSGSQEGLQFGGKQRAFEGTLGLVYRIEVHLPDTQNVDTYRAIFRAIREELGA